jgi:hypothetical protein
MGAAFIYNPLYLLLSLKNSVFVSFVTIVDLFIVYPVEQASCLSILVLKQIRSIMVRIYYKWAKKFLKRERGLRVKRGRMLDGKRRAKTDMAVVEVVAGSRAAIPRAIAPRAAT